MKDNEITQVINSVTKIANLYAGTEQLRDQLSWALTPMLRAPQVLQKWTAFRRGDGKVFLVNDNSLAPGCYLTEKIAKGTPEAMCFDLAKDLSLTQHSHTLATKELVSRVDALERSQSRDLTPKEKTGAVSVAPVALLLEDCKGLIEDHQSAAVERKERIWSRLNAMITLLRAVPVVQVPPQRINDSQIATMTEIAFASTNQTEGFGLHQYWYKRGVRDMQDKYLAAEQVTITKDEVREVFLDHEFTIKEGQTDLKDYVFQAAEALLAKVNVKVV